MQIRNPDDIDLASVEDRHPPRDRRVVTSLALLPQDHHALALLALQLGVDRSSLVRRAMIVAGILPSTPSTEARGT